MKTNNTARSITAAAIVGAAYAALTMLLAPISYGAIQVRVSEALCILPYFLPCTAWGLFAGCAIANVLTGNIFDIIFGSLRRCSPRRVSVRGSTPCSASFWRAAQMS